MEESKRIKEQRDQELRDEALNPVPEAEETGRDNKDKAKAIRNTKIEDEFDSKDIGTGGYGDRKDMPLTERKMRKDAEIRREEELKNSEAEKKDKQKRKEEKAGSENKDRSKATRNTSSYDEFGSKKAGPGGYSEAERKMRKEDEIMEEELKKAEEEKKDKQKRKKERQKDWGQ